jgi:hypothetical protein
MVSLAIVVFAEARMRPDGRVLTPDEHRARVHQSALYREIATSDAMWDGWRPSALIRTPCRTRNCLSWEQQRSWYTVMLDRFGFPLRCLEGEHGTVLWSRAGAPPQPVYRGAAPISVLGLGDKPGGLSFPNYGVMRDRVLPLRVIWLGWIGNALIFEALYVLIVVVVCRNGIRALRRRRGRCPACGYDLQRDLIAGCPECGWNRSANLPEAAAA